MGNFLFLFLFLFLPRKTASTGRYGSSPTMNVDGHGKNKYTNFSYTVS
jgi:hypothetical protein